MKVNTLIWGLVMVLTGPLCWAQIRSGQVTDENNLPLPGATIIVEGTSRGTTTDFDGNFQIEAQNEYTEESRYDVDENSFNLSWEILYTEVLKELETAKTLVAQEQIAEAVKTNKQNILDVMQVQAFSILTDGFGAVPYAAALDDNVSLPSYNEQSEIYSNMLNTLQNAVNSFDSDNPSFSSGDIIYDGNVDQWIRFANSLILRLAMRIVDVDPASARPFITSAITRANEDLSDEAIFTFVSTQERANPLWRDVEEDSRDDFCVATFLVESLRSRNDPRLEQFAKESSSGGIVGIPYGLSDNDATLLKPTTSRPNDRVRSATSPHPILTLAEVQFLKAEAYQRGIVSGSASEAYNSGIEASMSYWNITDESIVSTYIENNAYDASNWKSSIGWQKWIAFYTNGLEAWAEWRRLDYPELDVPEAAVENSIPTKLPYPNSEISNNSTELNKVSSDPTNITKKCGGMLTKTKKPTIYL